MPLGWADSTGGKGPGLQGPEGRPGQPLLQEAWGNHRVSDNKLLGAHGSRPQDSV